MQNKTARVQIRLPDGQSLRSEFAGTDSLAKVQHLVQEHYERSMGQRPRIQLTVMGVPPRQFASSEQMKITSLHDIGGVPSVTLAVRLLDLETNTSLAPPSPVPSPPSPPIDPFPEVPDTGEIGDGGAGYVLGGGEQGMGRGRGLLGVLGRGRGRGEQVWPAGQGYVLGGEAAGRGIGRGRGRGMVEQDVASDSGSMGSEEGFDEEEYSEDEMGAYPGVGGGPYMPGVGHLLGRVGKGGEEEEEEEEDDEEEMDFQSAEEPLSGSDGEDGEWGPGFQPFAGDGLVLGLAKRPPLFGPGKAAPSYSALRKGRANSPVVAHLRSRVVPTLESLCTRKVAARVKEYAEAGSFPLPTVVGQLVLEECIRKHALNARTIRAFHACQIRSLSLDHYSDATNRFLVSLVTHCGTLEILALRNCFAITRDVLPELCRLPHLRALSLSGCKVTDVGLAAIGQLGHVKELDLSYCKISDAGLGHLAALRQLEYLCVTNNPDITSASLPVLSVLRELDTLVLNGTNVGAGLDGLEKCERLSVLLLGSTQVGDEAVKTLCQLPLIELDVSNCRFHAPALLKLAESGVARTLEHLCPPASDCIVDDSVVALGMLVRLTDLELRHCLGVHHLSPLCRLSNLTSLSIMNSPVSDAGVAEIHGLTGLRSLELGHTGVTNRSVLGLVQYLTRLVRLGLGNTRVSDVGVQGLTRLQSLTELDVGGLRRLSERGVMALTALSNLRRLNVAACPRITAEVKRAHLWEESGWCLSSLMYRQAYGHNGRFAPALTQLTHSMAMGLTQTEG